MRLFAVFVALWSIGLFTAILATPGDGSFDALTPDLSRIEEQDRPRAMVVLGELASEVPEMTRRAGIDVGGPLPVVVERDYPSQARRLGAIGPAVVHDGRLHVVFDPGDARADYHLLRLELARLVVRRSGLELPPWVEDGASLWVASGGSQDADPEGGWYGRPWRQWLPHLAYARVLPTAGELLAGERPPDASEVLWTPVAAAFVDALPGEDLAAKLHEGNGELLDYATARSLAETMLARIAAAPSPAVDAVASTARPASRHASHDFHHGISFAMANGLETGYHAPAIRDQLARLCALGADALSLMPFAYQPGPHEPGLRFLNRHPASETDTGLLYAARRAHEEGFTVLWKPHLWISHQSWPGDVAMLSEAHWRSWFRSYRRYVLHHAILATHADARWFSVGVELGRTLEREAEWRHLIASVRRIYPGRVTYAGNWHAGYERVPFWDALDAVGVDAYFPLAGPGDSRAEIEDGARRAVARLAEAAKRWQKPVLLTEVGFAAHEGAWVAPHEEGGPYSAEDQRLAWEIFLDALDRPPWLAGLYVWKVFTHPATEESRRADFQVMGRPAEAEIGEYFRRLERPARVLATPQ